jgi:hypothetical protein
MTRRWFCLLMLAVCATLAQAAPVEPPRACRSADGVPQRLTGDEHGQPLKLSRCQHWVDRSGSYQLWLLASDDRVVGDHHLSRRLAAQLFRRQPDGTLAPQWAIHDRIADGEAGAWFSQRLTEFPDLDGNGVLTPVLVLRFVPLTDAADPDDPVADHPYAGRLKVILFREGTKVAVRAVTGDLDDERTTTATDSYFALPPAWRQHVQGRLRAWAHDRLFMSDDRGGSFVPKHERDAALR